MEAAGAPRSDAERRELVRRSTRGAGQRGLARREKSGLSLARRCRRAGRGTKRAPPGGGQPGCTCALETLALWAFHPTRLETRTKESNMYASRWVANPRRRK